MNDSSNFPDEALLTHPFEILAPTEEEKFSYDHRRLIKSIQSKFQVSNVQEFDAGAGSIPGWSFDVNGKLDSIFHMEDSASVFLQSTGTNSIILEDVSWVFLVGFLQEFDNHFCCNGRYRYSIMDYGPYDLDVNGPISEVLKQILESKDQPDESFIAVPEDILKSWETKDMTSIEWPGEYLNNDSYFSFGPPVGGEAFEYDGLKFFEFLKQYCQISEAVCGHADEGHKLCRCSLTAYKDTPIETSCMLYAPSNHVGSVRFYDGGNVILFVDLAAKFHIWAPEIKFLYFSVDGMYPEPMDFSDGPRATVERILHIVYGTDDLSFLE